jgi:hypothetical protein
MPEPYSSTDILSHITCPFPSTRRTIIYESPSPLIARTTFWDWTKRGDFAIFHWDRLFERLRYESMQNTVSRKLYRDGCLNILLYREGLSDIDQNATQCVCTPEVVWYFFLEVVCSFVSPYHSLYLVSASYSINYNDNLLNDQTNSNNDCLHHELVDVY